MRGRRTTRPPVHPRIRVERRELLWDLPLWAELFRWAIDSGPVDLLRQEGYRLFGSDARNRQCRGPNGRRPCGRRRGRHRPGGRDRPVRGWATCHLVRHRLSRARSVPRAVGHLRPLPAEAPTTRSGSIRVGPCLHRAASAINGERGMRSKCFWEESRTRCWTISLATSTRRRHRELRPRSCTTT